MPPLFDAGISENTGLVIHSKRDLRVFLHQSVTYTRDIRGGFSLEYQPPW